MGGHSCKTRQTYRVVFISVTDGRTYVAVGGIYCAHIHRASKWVACLFYNCLLIQKARFEKRPK